MNNQKKMHELIKRISGQQNILTIPRLYIDLLDGDIDAALFLSQSVYWSDKGKQRGGWFYKSRAEWQDEIGLSQYKVGRCADKCAGIIETKLKRANGAPTLHYRVDMQALEAAICKFLDFQEIDKSDLQETYKSDLQETDKSLTETTQETTQEIITDTHSSSFKTRDIQAAYQSCVPYKIDWVKGEGSAAKWLADAGYSPSEIKDCYTAIKSQVFWKDKPLSLASLKKQIGEWKTNVKHTEKELVFS